MACTNTPMHHNQLVSGVSYMPRTEHLFALPKKQLAICQPTIRAYPTTKLTQTSPGQQTPTRALLPRRKCPLQPLNGRHLTPPQARKHNFIPRGGRRDGGARAPDGPCGYDGALYQDVIPANVAVCVAKACVLTKKVAAERALRELGGEEWVFAVDAATGV